MTSLALAINAVFGVAILLLVTRLLILRWTSWGGMAALAFVFLYLLISFGAVEAMIGGFLMLIAAPTLGRSAFGGALMRALRALTDPVIGAVRGLARGRIGEGWAIVVALVAIWTVRFAVLLPLLR